MRALAKPSVAAWTVNQLARRRRPRVRELLAAGEAVRAAQERALRGGGAGDALRAATQDERRVVAELRREARALLEEHDRPVSDALLERVATTLSNAAVDPESRPLLEAGRLTQEVEASGFDAFAGMAVPAGRSRRPAAAAKPKPKRKREEDTGKRAAEADAAAQRREGARLRSRARELEREARAAEREAQRAAEAAARAARTAEEAAAEAAEAEEAARRARRAAEEARAEADAAG